MRTQLSQATLYGILDMGYVTAENAAHTAEQLCTGGVDILQLRAKNWQPEQIAPLAATIATITKKHGIPFIINDFPTIAIAAGADGVHIGQDDGTLADVRKIVGPNMIVGRSTHSPEQAIQACADGFDYIGFGPLFPTPTKAGRPSIGLENIAAMEEQVGKKIPMFCIGGITPHNWSLVHAAGAKRIVVVSALLTAPNIITEVQAWKKSLSSCSVASPI